MDKKQLNVKDILINNGIVILILLMVLFVGVTKQNFFSRSNFSNISINVACRFIIAVGVSGCLITKGTDLSAGRLVGLSACLAGTLLQKSDYSGHFEPTKGFGEQNVWLILLICVAISCVFGLINGIVVAYLNVPAFIGTLGMQMIVYGINLVYTKSVPLGGYRQDYTIIANGNFCGIPYLFIIAFVIGAIMWFVFNYTRHGKYMYAIGGNEAAAEVAGVNVKKTKIIIYITAAACYALGGFLVGAKSGGSSVNMGYGWELEAIAACTIGGVSVTGGRGKVSSALVGVAVFEFLKAALQFLGVNAYAQYIALGVIIFIAISLDIRKYIARK